MVDCDVTFLMLVSVCWSSSLGTAVLAHTFYIHTHLPHSNPCCLAIGERVHTDISHTLLPLYSNLYIPRINHTDTLMLVWTFIFASFCLVCVGCSQTPTLCRPNQIIESRRNAIIKPLMIFVWGTVERKDNKSYWFVLWIYVLIMVY